MIKKYLTFINERKIIESIDNNELKVDYGIDRNAINELFINFLDNDYEVYIKYGFVSEQTIDDGEIKCVDRILKVLDHNYPVIEIYIDNDDNNNNNNVDLVDSLKTIVEYLSSSYSVQTYIDYINVDIESIKMEDGHFCEGGNKEKNMTVYLILDKYVNFSEFDIVKYHEVSDYETDGENIYIEIEMEKLAGVTLHKNSDYINLIKDDVEMDHYNDYRMDYKSLFEYHINNENSEKIIKSMLEEYNGDDGDFLTENDLDIKDIINSEKLISKLSNDLLFDVLNTYTDWESQDHFYKNVDEAIDNFDKKLKEEEGLEFEKYQKEIEVSGYKEMRTFYKIKYLDIFLENKDDKDDVKDESLYELFRTYCQEEISIKLNPSFTDYGNVDFDDFNKEVSNMIKIYK